MIGFLGSRIGRLLSMLLAAAGVVIGVFLAGKREGRAKEQTKVLKDSVKRQEKGREAVQDLRGSSRDELIDRVRRNDGQW